MPHLDININYELEKGHTMVNINWHINKKSLATQCHGLSSPPEATVVEWNQQVSFIIFMTVFGFFDPLCSDFEHNTCQLTYTNTLVMQTLS